MKKALTFATLLLVTLSACQKENIDQDEQTSADETTQFENLLTVDESTFDELYLNETPESFPPAPCATVTRDTTTTPRTITIDYGTVNCLCADGRMRRGVVVISYTGQRRTAGSSYSVAFANYFVNNQAVTGSISGAFSLNNGNPLLTRSSNLLLVSATNDSVQRTTNRSIEMIVGYSTPARTDDVFLISGSSSTTRNGFTFSQTINTPLRKEVSCNWLVSGNMTMTRGTNSRTIDFGNGSCDDQATVTMNGRTRTITLP